MHRDVNKTASSLKPTAQNQSDTYTSQKTINIFSFTIEQVIVAAKLSVWYHNSKSTKLQAVLNDDFRGLPQFSLVNAKIVKGLL
jgi:lipid II:glycine glycyltransferase (peptidoglycan interpeptide bridge formation enzyme)